MKQLAIFLIIGYVCLAANEAAAKDGAMTVGDLQQICVGSDESSKAGCRFYILGVTQGIEMGMDIADGKTRGGRPCIPPNVSGTALEFAVKSKLGQDLMFYPKDRSEDASGFVAAALVTTFPCRRSK